MKISPVPGIRASEGLLVNILRELLTVSDLTSPRNDLDWTDRSNRSSKLLILLILSNQGLRVST